jgi:hypothetical protein
MHEIDEFVWTLDTEIRTTLGLLPTSRVVINHLIYQLCVIFVNLVLRGPQ